MDAALTADLRKGTCTRHPQVKAEDMIVTAVHTHSGPSTFDSPGWGSKDNAYCDHILIPQTLKAVDAAFENMQPARMGINTTECEAGINRRQYGPSGGGYLGHMRQIGAVAAMDAVAAYNGAP